jgi:hypothetical protein
VLVLRALCGAIHPLDSTAEPGLLCRRPVQVWVGVVPTGPSGAALNGSFASRESTGYQLELGNTVVNFARLVPDGLLVFFPSYSLLQKCLDAWGWASFAPEEEQRRAQRERAKKDGANGGGKGDCANGGDPAIPKRVTNEQLDARQLQAFGGASYAHSNPAFSSSSSSSSSSSDSTSAASAAAAALSAASTPLSCILTRIFALKHIVVEPRSSAELNATLQEYQDKLNDASKAGAVLFAVARGKVAEVLISGELVSAFCISSLNQSSSHLSLLELAFRFSCTLIACFIVLLHVCA